MEVKPNNRRNQAGIFAQTAGSPQADHSAVYAEIGKFMETKPYFTTDSSTHIPTSALRK